MQGEGIYKNVRKFEDTDRIHCALKEAERYNIRVERAHSSSASALENVLQGCC